jgi:hypothetical protein
LTTQRWKSSGWDVINYDVGGDSCELLEKKGPFYKWQCAAGGWYPAEAIVDCRDRKFHTMTGGVDHELIAKNAGTEKAELNDDGSRFLRLRWHPQTKEYATFPIGPEGELSSYTVVKVYPFENKGQLQKQDKCICQLSRDGLLSPTLDMRSYTQRFGQPNVRPVKARCARSRE